MELALTRTLIDWLTTFVIVATGRWALAEPVLETSVLFATTMAIGLHVFRSSRNVEGPCGIETAVSVVHAGLFSLAALVASALAVGRAYAPAGLIGSVLLVVLGIIAQRIFIGTIARRFDRKTARPVIIYGAGSTGQLLAQRLIQEKQLGLEPIGFVDDDPGARGREVRVGPGARGARLAVLGPGTLLGELIERHRPAGVFMASPSTTPRRAAELESVAESHGVPWHSVPEVGERALASLRWDTVGGLPVFTKRRPFLHGAYLAAKRLSDIVGSVAVLVLTSPLLAITAILVRATSPGPAFFTQRRVGLGGRLFTIYKLRTMYSDAPTYGLHPAAAGDRRVTPIGRWLRRLSIDELPQLYNVLRGDMSLVGPRPEMPFIAATYDDTQLQRLTVKPGLTGLWQISPDRTFLIHENMQYDLYYVENCSFVVDLAVCLLTPFMLLARDRAK